MYFALRKVNPLFALQQEKLDTVNDVLQEDISAIRIIKACVRETYEKLRFGKANDDLIKTQLKVLLTLAFMSPIVNMLMNLSIAAILWFGARDVMEGTASPGSIMAAITYTTQLLMGIMMLMMLFQNISRGFISWKRLETVLHLEPEIQDGKFEVNINEQGRIEFVNVSFTYPGSQKPVLENINLTIEPGETIAIMGSTGSGKTTLINLIPRFYDVTEGSVRIDGVDVRDYKVSALRRKIAIALQKSELFSTSIKENIAWGKDEAADPDIERAARIAQAHEFIAPLEQGYDTVVAERGMSLSGGQKQRIALARAVLKDSHIMIFDDATSALDLKTEANFYNELAKTSPNSTKIIVAQRIASVRRANRILILENGEIVAEGTHKELLKSCAIYQDIYQSQVGDITQSENVAQQQNQIATNVNETSVANDAEQPSNLQNTTQASQMEKAVSGHE
jgi:ATP-binding cassette subfamily B protein